MVIHLGALPLFCYGGDYLAKRLPDYTITEEIYRSIKNPELEKIRSAESILRSHSDIISNVPSKKKKSKRRE